MAEFQKIPMKTPLVEMDGDEMTRVIWKMIKDILLLPYIDLNTEYYDLGLENRDKTNDQVTVDSALATKKYGVAVKCATITPNAARMDEYHLKEMWKSPNGTIRAILDGTVFRTPILVQGHHPLHPRLAQAHHHRPPRLRRCVQERGGPGPRGGKGGAAGHQGRRHRGEIPDPPVRRPRRHPGACTTLTSSIESFARSCFNFALDAKQDLWFATKDTISKKYDHRFKDIFQEIYDEEYAGKFQQAGHRVLLHPHRRRGGPCGPQRGRLYLGLQKLRRRRDERHGGHSLRLSGHDDLRAGGPRRHLRVRGRPRHRHSATTTST